MNPKPAIVPHGPETLVLAASAFAPVAGGGASLNADGEWTFGSASKLHMAIPVPAGRVVRSVTVHFDRGGAGTIDFRVKRRTPGSASANVAANQVTTGTGWTTSAITLALSSYREINVVAGSIDSTFSMFLEVQIDNAAHVIGHVVVAFDAYPA